MDLGSLLNRDSDAQRTTSRIQSQPLSQSTPTKAPYASRSEPPRADLSPPPHPSIARDRPQQPPPLYTNDPRSPPSASAYPPVQSPYQQGPGLTSALGGGPPGYPFPVSGHGVPSQQHPIQTGPPSHGNHYNNVGFTQSQSPQSYHPMTPGPHSAYHSQQRPPSSHSAASSTPSFPQYPPRESPSAPSGPPAQHHQARQYSPYAQQAPQPGTPLGPPASYQRPSPSAQRHPAEYDHSRTYSSGSIGNAPPPSVTPSSQTAIRRDSTGRQLSYDSLREKSQSVSPKTVVRPAPHSRRVSESPSMDRTTPGARSYDRAPSEHAVEVLQPGRLTEQLETPTPIAVAAMSHQRTYSSSQASSAYQSPPAQPPKIQTPRSNNAHLPAQSMPATSLKRDASAISGSSTSPPPPARKRFRPDEIPIFARSARASKFKKFNGGASTEERGPSAPPHPVQSVQPLQPVQQMQQVQQAQPTQPVQPTHKSSPLKQEPNGQVTDKRVMSQPVAVPPGGMPWEPSIQNVVPYEDLTRVLCDRIFFNIGMVDPPQGGAKFEIEAKLGEIQIADEHARIRMPVLTECLVDRDSVNLPKTRFESSMNMGHHKHLNEFLNSCLIQTQNDDDREMIHYKHTREIDNFYELTPLARDRLPEHITKYLRNAMHKPRVRITTDRDTGAVVAKIIKVRLADFDIFNPRCLFDFRISVNLESPWNGSEDHLVMLNEAEGRRGERRKDRMSYRHLAYQIDLTQVSYSATNKQEHELEVEVSPDALRAEIQRARDGQPNRYEDLVRTFMDNVRILSRQFQVR